MELPHYDYDDELWRGGPRLVTVQLPGAVSAAVGVWVGVGSRHEPERVAGVSHFLEHLVFKGTRSRTCDQLKNAVEGHGGSLNAYTAEEYTCYCARTLRSRVATALDVLLDMVTSPRLAPRDIVTERNVILEEMRMHADQPAHHVHELICELLWPGHPLGRPISGTPDTVQRLTRADLRRHARWGYVPSRMIVVCVGSVDVRAVRRVIRQRVGRLRRRLPAGATVGRAPIKRRAAASLRVAHKQTEQTHVCLAVHALRRADPDRYAEEVLNVVLGANMSSRLFREVRERRGLTYEIGSYLKRYRDTGALIVSAGCEHRNLVQSVEVIVRQLRGLAERRVAGAELRRAKDYCLGQVVMGLEDANEHMLWLGEMASSTGRLPQPERICRAIEGVSQADVRRVARRLFCDRALHAAVIGPVTTGERGAIAGALGR